MPPPSSSQVQIASLFIPEIQQLLNSQDFKELKKLLHTISVIDLAEAWDRFSPTEQTLLFRLLSDQNATTLFQELEPGEQTHLLHSLQDTELAELIEDFDPEEAARLFHELPPRTVRTLSNFLKKEQRESVARILNYPEHSVGSWLHLQRMELFPNLTAGQALSRIRSTQRLRSGGGPDGYYVTDKGGKAVGSVSLRKLISAPSKTPLNQFMTPIRLLRLTPEQDQEEAIRLFRRYKLSMAPIVDDDNKLLGYIQAEDILPLIEEEVTEDIAKMAGTESEEFESESILRVARLRLPWLVATCVGEFLVSLIIDRFDFVLSQVIALAAFMPLIAAMGGNVGSQSSTILVRGMAIEEFKFSDRWKILFRELRVGLILGCSYGLTIMAVAYLLFGTQLGTMFAVVVGLGMLVSMTVATVVGVIGPFSLAHFGFDPATATGPLISTITDIISVTAYFLFAVWLLI